jgi:hypothetical protein
VTSHTEKSVQTRLLRQVDARDARLALPKEISMKKFLLALLAIAALSGSIFVVQSVATPSPAAAYEPPDPC